MKAEEIIKVLEEKIQEELSHKSYFPSEGYEDYISNIDYFIHGLEFAISILKDLKK